MDANIRSRVNAAQHLSEEIGRISAIDRQRNQRGFGQDFNDQNDAQAKELQPVGGALPVSPPDNLAGKSLKVVVVDAAAKEDLANRLQEAKSNLLDLCARQLNDLLDEAPSEQKDMEDVDELLSEMQAVRRSMETMVAIERALHDSRKETAQ